MHLQLTRQMTRHSLRLLHYSAVSVHGMCYEVSQLA
jgi:hypothetical protein